MADQKPSDAGPSGSGRGSGGRGGSKKTKFMPTVPSRRKKDDTAAAGGVTAADAAAINEEFKDLIKAAETGSAWQRGRGRGRGLPGRGSQQQAFQVAFGGSSLDRPSLPAAKPGSYRPGGSGAGPSRGAGAAGTSGAKVKAEGKPGEEHEEADEQEDEQMAEPSRHFKEEKKFAVAEALDYSQYYPTTLPLRPLDAPPRYQDDGDGLPVDLAITADQVVNAAEELGLMSVEEEQQLFLVQLPSVLPISAASRAAALAGAAAAAAAAEEPEVQEAAGTSSAPTSAAGSKSAAAAAAAAAAAGVGAESRGCTLKELPSGSIGRLLVFKSGKVKLQMGDVLMNVSPGLPCQHRMDVAAINCQAGHCVLLGDIGKRMVVSPDIWQLIEDAEVPNYQSAGGAAATNGQLHSAQHAGAGSIKPIHDGGGADVDMADGTADADGEEQEEEEEEDE